MIFILKKPFVEKLKRSCLACYSLWRKTVPVKFVVSLSFVKLQQIGYRPNENLWIIMMVWMSKSLSLKNYENVWTHSQGDLQLYMYRSNFVISVVCFMLNCNKLVLFLITRYRYIFTAWMTKLVHALWYVRAQPVSIRQP